MFTLVGSLAGGTAPIGLLLAAPIAEIAGPGAFYLASGAICVAMGIVGFFSSDLMRIEEAPRGDTESPADRLRTPSEGTARTLRSMASRHCKRNPKVRDHGLALVEKNVLGLHVAVDQPWRGRR